MNIAIVAPHRTLGGGECALRTLMKYCPQHRFRVLYLEEPAADAAVVDYSALPHVTCEPVRDLRRQLADCAVVVFYGPTTPAVLEWRAAASGRPAAVPKLLYVGQCNDDNWNYQWWRQCRDVVDAAVAVSGQIGMEMMRLDVDANWRPGYERLFVIPEGVDRSVYQEGRSHHAVHTIGYVGRIAAGKGMELLPSVVAHMGLTLLMAGPRDADTWTALVRACERARVKLRYREPVQYPVEAYREIDVLMLLSANEGCPVSVLEAAAMGVPTIATRVGTLPDYWTHRDNIWFVDGPSDARATLRRLLADPAEYEHVARRAASQAARFDARRTAEKYERVFQGLRRGRLPLARGYILGRDEGDGDVLCAQPLLDGLRKRGVPYVLHSRAAVARMLDRSWMPLHADRPIPLIYESPGPHICDQYAEQLGLDPGQRPSLEIPQSANRHDAKAPKTPDVGDLGDLAVPDPQSAIRIGLHAYTARPVKQWPMRRWTALAKSLLDYGMVVQADPGPSIAPGVPQWQTLPVEEYAARMASLSLLVCVEGFPHHLAHALRVPAVVIWTGAAAERLSAYDDQTIVRSPLECRCTATNYADRLPASCPARLGQVAPCMDAITVEHVLAAVQAALAGAQPPSAGETNTQSGATVLHAAIPQEASA